MLNLEQIYNDLLNKKNGNNSTLNQQKNERPAFYP